MTPTHIYTAPNGRQWPCTPHDAGKEIDGHVYVVFQGGGQGCVPSTALTEQPDEGTP